MSEAIRVGFGDLPREMGRSLGSRLPLREAGLSDGAREVLRDAGFIEARELGLAESGARAWTKVLRPVLIVSAAASAAWVMGAREACRETVLEPPREAGREVASVVAASNVLEVGSKSSMLLTLTVFGSPSCVGSAVSVSSAPATV